MTQKALRKVARDVLAKALKDPKIDQDKVNAAIQVLHAPQVEGE